MGSQQARGIRKEVILQHPMKEFEELLKKQDPNDTREQLVLVSTGAYCPVHKMHIQVFQAAKKYLSEKHNFNVIAGFISPSHDKYVSSKLGGSFIPSKMRAEMIRLVTKSHEEFSWILVDEWESSMSTFLSFEFVLADIDREIKELFPKHKIRCMYLCGADLIIRCGGMTSVDPYSVVAVGRPGYSDTIKRLKKESKEAEELYFVEEDTDDISSTKIRERMEKGLPLDDLTFKEVCDYIALHKLEC